MLLIATFAVSGYAQQAMPCPMDPNVRYGKLDNGLTYYIRHNEKPAKRADFYIAQKVGSVLEEESQRGLAHFLEHMAFNGTTNLPGMMLREYLQSRGIKFGENLNAGTGIDQTVYMVTEVPTDLPGLVTPACSSYTTGQVSSHSKKAKSTTNAASSSKNSAHAKTQASAS